MAKRNQTAARFSWAWKLPSRNTRKNRQDFVGRKFRESTKIQLLRSFMAGDHQRESVAANEARALHVWLGDGLLSWLRSRATIIQAEGGAFFRRRPAGSGATPRRSIPSTPRAAGKIRGLPTPAARRASCA